MHKIITSYLHHINFVSERQYGFVEGRRTVDVLTDHVRHLVAELLKD